MMYPKAATSYHLIVPNIDTDVLENREYVRLLQLITQVGDAEINQIRALVLVTRVEGETGRVNGLDRDRLPI